jgi:hypothetical protein
MHQPRRVQLPEWVHRHALRHTSLQRELRQRSVHITKHLHLQQRLDQGRQRRLHRGRAQPDLCQRQRRRRGLWLLVQLGLVRS